MTTFLSSKCLALSLGVTLLVGGFAALPDEPVAVTQEMPEPGKQHKWMAERAGDWKVSVKMRMMPEMPWMEFDGTEKVKVGLNGFFVFSTFKCSFMNMPFEGHQTLGYDQNKKKYVSSWVDSMSSQLATSEGTYDAKKKVLTLVGMSFDPMQGKQIKQRTTIHSSSKDKSVMKMFTPDPSGKEFQSMEFHYTRAK